MIRRVAIFLPAAAFGMACSAAIQLAPVPPGHPASPRAPEGAFVDTSAALRPEAQDAARTGTPAGAQPGPEEAAGGAMGHSGHEAGPGQAPEHGGVVADPGSGQKKAAGSQPPSPSRPSTGMYSCPMLPEVLLDKPGACPKCGMPLVRKERSE